MSLQITQNLTGRLSFTKLVKHKKARKELLIELDRSNSDMATVDMLLA